MVIFPLRGGAEMQSETASTAAAMAAVGIRNSK
jgi:hypothetical protein